MSNAELLRQAKLDLESSLGQADWQVLMDSEGYDIKMLRKPVLLTYYQNRQVWGAHIIGTPGMQYGHSASEAYLGLRKYVEFISSLSGKI